LAPSNYQSRAADVLGARGHGGEVRREGGREGGRGGEVEAR